MRCVTRPRNDYGEDIESASLIDEHGYGICCMKVAVGLVERNDCARAGWQIIRYAQHRSALGMGGQLSGPIPLVAIAVVSNGPKRAVS